MLYRNAAAPWLLAAGGLALGLVGFKVVSKMSRRGRARHADVAAEEQSRGAALRQSGGNAAQETDPALVPELLGEELDALLSGGASVPGDAYDAVAPDELASEWLSRVTEAPGVASATEPLDAHVAELLRDEGISIISEGSLNSASPDQLEAAAEGRLDDAEDAFELEFDDASLGVRH